MNIKNAKDTLARAKGNIATAIAWLEQEEAKSKKDREADYAYVEVATLRKIIKEEVKEYMKKWVQDHIYDIK